LEAGMGPELAKKGGIFQKAGRNPVELVGAGWEVLAGLDVLLCRGSTLQGRQPRVVVFPIGMKY